jgi:hypothetical protein
MGLNVPPFEKGQTITPEKVPLFLDMTFSFYKKIANKPSNFT